MRYWDGEQWGAKRDRVGPEVTPPEPRKQNVGWLVPCGYVFAVLVPVLGFTLGIIAATRGAKATPRHGIQIILLSVVVFLAGVLLLHHHR
jgi:hypothetical protein